MSRRTRRVRMSPSRGRKTPRPVFVLVVLAAVLVLAGGYLVAAGWLGRAGAPAAPATGPAAVQASEPGRVPALRVSPAAFDLGAVSQARGVVTVELGVANAGSADLVIEEMETSCGCTRAALLVEGRPGPWFGMRGHGEWPTGWSARLRPNQQATLQVQYDPDAHGIFRGPIDRVVIIHSNDPRQPHARVRLTGTQVP